MKFITHNILVPLVSSPPSRTKTKCPFKSRLFLQEKELLDVIGLDCCHKCREEPFEAAVYSLEAEGQVLEKFRADSKAELTVEVEDSSKDQQEKKQEHSSLELPDDFSKEDVTRVNA